jgi:hypothetical protein
MVIRIEGLGDLFCTTLVILALHERCPDARIDALVATPHSREPCPLAGEGRCFPLLAGLSVFQKAPQTRRAATRWEAEGYGPVPGLI